MKTMKILFACTLLLSLAACGDDDDTAPPADSPPADGTGADTTPPPQMPALGAQIDRMGRPAINTALTHPFDPDMDSKFAAKDAYNADGDPQNWATYIPEFAANLAVFDGLDNPVGANGCGNQILACGTGACAGP